MNRCAMLTLESEGFSRGIAMKEIGLILFEGEWRWKLQMS